jgi:hypothetical protein
MPMRSILATILLAACGGGAKAPVTPTAGWACPPSISAAVTREHPDATQKGCKVAHENGTEIYEASIVMRDGSPRELELSLDGAILAVEESVSPTALPRAVAEAFAARYPDAQPQRVERVTPRGRPPIYEIAFGGHEATFSDTGAFIEEEQGGGDKD